MGTRAISPERKATLVVWAPITLEPPITGDKVNEAERIGILSKEFAVHAFVLIALGEIAKARTYANGWFENCQARITVIPWLNIPGFRILSQLMAATIAAFHIAVLQLTRRVDMMISRGAWGSLPLVVVSKATRTRFVYNVLSVPFQYLEAQYTKGIPILGEIVLPIMRVIEYFVLGNADYVAVANEATSQALEAVLGRSYKKKIILLPYPIADEFFDNPPEVREKTISLVYAGSIGGIYDFSQLFRALEALNGTGQIAPLTIHTSQEGRQLLERLAPNKMPFLTLKNEVSKKELIEVLRQATAVVIPRSSPVPGVPRKAIEAMALGVPVVISNPPDSGIFRDGETCIVVSEDTSQGWQNAIIQTTIPRCRERIIRGARAESESFRSVRNLEVLSGLLWGQRIVRSQNMPISTSHDGPSQR